MIEDIVLRFIRSGYFRSVVITSVLSLAIRLIGIYVLYKLLDFIMSKTLFRLKKIDPKVRETFAGLIRTITRIIFTLMAIFTVLESVGINTASLVATAGVGGVAIGFGAQSLVKDVITGFFILIEGQFFVGDEVVVGNVQGVVEDFGLKSTKIQDFETGAIHIIPNGNITAVENRSIKNQFSRIFIDVPEHYPIDKLFDDVSDILTGYNDSRIVREPELRGIEDSPERYNRIFIHTIVKKDKVYQFTRDLRGYVLDEMAKKGYALNSPLLLLNQPKEDN